MISYYPALSIYFIPYQVNQSVCFTACNFGVKIPKTMEMSYKDSRIKYLKIEIKKLDHRKQKAEVRFAICISGLITNIYSRNSFFREHQYIL